LTSSDHYFRPRPDLPSAIRRFSFTVRGVTLTVETDRGVFGRQQLDEGSRLLLELAPLAPGQAVLDLGCGWGAIGLVAARLVAPGEVTMVDVNPRALELARRNARINGLANVRVLASDGFDALASARFDRILLNPPIRAGKAVYYPWLAAARDHLAPGGQLIAVVRVQQGADSFARQLAALYPEVRRLGRRKGYVVLAAGEGEDR
jgi:16S rRNA (guanine1207-N2)-methyltransferase